MLLFLIEQKQAGKKLFLMTNSDWSYTRQIMQHAVDPHLPAGLKWQDLFDLIFVSARKPHCFTQRQPLHRIVDIDKGVLAPCHGISNDHKLYAGADAVAIEQFFDLSGTQILYVGDHIYGDVLASKKALRWRTALVLAELATDLQALRNFRDTEKTLEELMQNKEEII